MGVGYSAEQVRAAEAPLLAAGEPLMRVAAAGLAAELRKVLHDRPARPDRSASRRVLLLVGPGNNGGDALYAGAELAAEGVTVTVVPTGSKMHEEAVAAALDAGARVVEADPDAVSRLASGADVVVDGILGTGTSAQSPALRGRASELVAAILPVLDRPLRPDVVAVDLPSGTSPDDGAVPNPVVLPADVTVTFGAVKAGLLIDPARRLAGEVRLIDIGLGPQLAAVEPLIRRGA